MRGRHLLHQTANNLRARGVGQSGEFVEMFLDVFGVARALARRANQDGALGRVVDRDQRANGGACGVKGR
jgi:hypothetical protein